MTAGLLCASGCASTPRGSESAGQVEATRHVDFAAPSATLAGARCQAGACHCRAPGDDAEAVPPAEGYKRFEIRMLVAGGQVMLDSPTLGRFAHDGVQEKCFYVDVPAGSSHEAIVEAREADRGRGMAPQVRIAEYGPKGPFWYDVLAVACGTGDTRCTRDGMAAWGQRWLAHRKRGRLDPCGSAVVSGLKWDTSGAQADRDGGALRDVRVQFVLQVKRFATQFAPGSTECVPK
jgi:hypothetical protein